MLSSQVMNARSFDFDLSIFNRNYLTQFVKENLAHNLTPQTVFPDLLSNHNQYLINSIASDIKNNSYADVVLMLGSNRQSLNIDRANSERGGSCFPALNKLCEILNKKTNNQCRVDPYLLADTYNNRQHGENFNNALNKKSLSELDDNNQWLFDDSKLTIYYAQMHKISSANPNNPIFFDVYDDKQLEILSPLYVCFSENQALIPRNVTLRLHGYAGDGINSYKVIQGKGEIDYNFENNIKLMIQLADRHFPKDANNEDNNIYEELAKNNNNGLTQFLNQRKTRLTANTIPETISQDDHGDDAVSGEDKLEAGIEENSASVIAHKESLKTSVDKTFWAKLFDAKTWSRAFSRKNFFDQYPWMIIIVGVLIGLVLLAIIAGILFSPAPIGAATATLAASLTMGKAFGLSGIAASGLGLSVIGSSIVTVTTAIAAGARALWRYFFPVAAEDGGGSPSAQKQLGIKESTTTIEEKFRKYREHKALEKQQQQQSQLESQTQPESSSRSQSPSQSLTQSKSPSPSQSSDHLPPPIKEEAYDKIESDQSTEAGSDSLLDEDNKKQDDIEKKENDNGKKKKEKNIVNAIKQFKPKIKKHSDKSQDSKQSHKKHSKKRS